METLIIAALIIVGLVLFIIEVFLIPGISLAGIASFAAFLYAIYYAFTAAGTTVGLLTIGVSIVGVVIATVWCMKSKTVDKLSLHKAIDYTPDPLKGIDLEVGDRGTAITRLTLIGNAEFKGNIIEVQSADGFIDEKTPVEVCRITDKTVYVRQAAE